MQVLENLIHRLRRFAETHTQVQTFSHGQVTDFDLDKLPTYPVMHVVWNGIDTPVDQSELVYQFQILFADKPTIAEDKPDQALYAMNDCVNYALDLLAVIKQGEEGDIFNDDFSIASASIQAVQEAYSNVLWGCVLNIGISVHHPYNLCDAPIGTISGDFTPCTLCNVIAGKTALQILECLTAEQEAALSAELCEAAGVATYTNGAAFTQEINAGETYTAPQVQMTAVDGTTENIPANTNYVCEWKTVQVRATDGEFIGATLSAYPAGGNADTLQYRFRNSDGSIFATLPARGQIKLINANIAAAANDTPNPITTNITVDVDVPVVNSAGDSVGSNVDDLLNAHPLPDLPVTDSNGAVGSYPMPTTLTVVGQVNSATYSGGTLTITPAGGGGALSLIPKRPHLTQVTSYGYGTEGWAIAQGYLTYLDEGRQQDLDLTAANPFTTLKHSMSGSTARFRDSAGNDLIYGGLTVADGIVGDYLTDLMHYVIPFTNGAGYADILTKVEALNTANHAGYNDWFLTPRCVIEALFDFNSTNSPSTSLGRPPGFSSSWLNAIATGTTYETNTGFIYLGWPNGTDRLITFRGKTASNLNNYMICRRMNAY